MNALGVKEIRVADSTPVERKTNAQLIAEIQQKIANFTILQLISSYTKVQHELHQLHNSAEYLSGNQHTIMAAERLNIFIEQAKIEITKRKKEGLSPTDKADAVTGTSSSNNLCSSDFIKSLNKAGRIPTQIIQNIWCTTGGREGSLATIQALYAAFLAKDAQAEAQLIKLFIDQIKEGGTGVNNIKQALIIVNNQAAKATGGWVHFMNIAEDSSSASGLKNIFAPIMEEFEKFSNLIQEQDGLLPAFRFFIQSKPITVFFTALGAAGIILAAKNLYDKIVSKTVNIWDILDFISSIFALPQMMALIPPPFGEIFFGIAVLYNITRFIMDNKEYFAKLWVNAFDPSKALMEKDEQTLRSNKIQLTPAATALINDLGSFKITAPHWAIKDKSWLVKFIWKPHDLNLSAMSLSLRSKILAKYPWLYMSNNSSQEDKDNLVSFVNYLKTVANTQYRALNLMPNERLLSIKNSFKILSQYFGTTDPQKLITLIGQSNFSSDKKALLLLSINNIKPYNAEQVSAVQLIKGTIALINKLDTTQRKIFQLLNSGETAAQIKQEMPQIDILTINKIIINFQAIYNKLANELLKIFQGNTQLYMQFIKYANTEMHLNLPSKI